jgi:hypothetical protein
MAVSFKGAHFPQEIILTALSQSLLRGAMKGQLPLSVWSLIGRVTRFTALWSCATTLCIGVMD